MFSLPMMDVYQGKLLLQEAFPDLQPRAERTFPTALRALSNGCYELSQ